MFDKLFKSLFGKKEVPPVVSGVDSGNGDLPVAAAIAACMQYQTDLELVAVITAALAQHLDVPPEGLIVRSIRKTSPWSEQSRLLKANY